MFLDENVLGTHIIQSLGSGWLLDIQSCISITVLAMCM